MTDAPTSRDTMEALALQVRQQGIVLLALSARVAALEAGRVVAGPAVGGLGDRAEGVEVARVTDRRLLGSAEALAGVGVKSDG